MVTNDSAFPSDSTLTQPPLSAPALASSHPELSMGLAHPSGSPVFPIYHFWATSSIHSPLHQHMCFSYSSTAPMSSKGLLVQL